MKDLKYKIILGNLFSILVYLIILICILIATESPIVLLTIPLVIPYFFSMNKNLSNLKQVEHSLNNRGTSILELYNDEVILTNTEIICLGLDVFSIKYEDIVELYPKRTFDFRQRNSSYCLVIVSKNKKKYKVYFYNLFSPLFIDYEEARKIIQVVKSHNFNVLVKDKYLWKK